VTTGFGAATAIENAGIYIALITKAQPNNHAVEYILNQMSRIIENNAASVAWKQLKCRQQW
jgi:hypothetical protein